MASSSHDLNDGDQLVSHRTTRQGGGHEDVDSSDHVRSWLGATSAPDYYAPPRDGINHVALSHQQSLTSHGDEVESIEIGELPPAYRETDPAKDYPSTYEFEIDDNSGKKAKLYTPFFLRIPVLMVFVFIFALMFIAVEVMNQFSMHGHGLSVEDPNNYYLWTWGPTLFLTVIACLWGQVEYRIKQLMPWKAMVKVPVPAEDCLLLDYVSPWNVTALIMALKKKHIAVVLAILGSLLIKLAIIFAAGFLSIGYSPVFKDEVPMELRDAFTTSNSYPNSTNIQPVIAVIGASQYGLPFPPGTTDTFATQSFNVVNNVTDLGSILMANVDVFFGDLWCEVGTVSQISSPQCTGRNTTNSCEKVSYNITVTSDTCTTNSSQVSVSIDESNDQYYGSVTSSPCIDSDSTDLRLTFLTGHETISYTDAGNVTGSTALICTPSYDVCEYNVEAFLNETISDICSCNGTCYTPSIALDLGSVILDMVQSASTSNLVLFEKSEVAYNGSFVNLDPFFQFMNATALPEDITAFQNVTYLEDTARQLFAGLAAQIAKGELTEPSGDRIMGSTLAHQQQLFVREVSLRLLEVIFAILIIITLVLLLLRPVASTPSDVSTIAGLASVLARSPRVAMAVQGLGSARFSDIKQQLMGRTFHTTVSNDDGPTFRITPVANNSHTDDETEPSGPTLWWRPKSLSISVRICLVVIPLGLIAALEAVYQVSDRYDGLADVYESGSVLYTWTYLPALAMMLALTGYEAVHFNTRLLQPFKTLRQSPALADRSVVINYLSCLTPIAIWKGITNRHYAVVNSGLIMMIVPLLVVVSSGLFQAGLVDRYIPAPMNVNRTIDNAHAWATSNSADSNLARTISILIAEANMSFISWTYDGYVVPELDSQAFLNEQFGANSTANTTSVRVQLPAYSAALNCELTSYEPTAVVNQTGKSYVDIMVQVPDGCGNATSDGDYWDLGSRTLIPGRQDYGFTYIRENATMPSFCPQVAFVYGQASVFPINSSVAWDLVAAYCTPTVFTVMVNATFYMPDFLIQSIEADMTPKTNISQGGAGNATLDIENWFPATDWGVDSFYGGLSPGRDGIAWEDLIGTSNFDTFSKHADDLYAIVYSQWLNIYGRVNATAETDSLDALIIDPTRSRLMQSAVSTRLLEALLALLAICTLVGYFLLDTKEVLPFNPCSIAAMCTLLADSDMLKIIPEGAEWFDEKQLAKKRVFSDHLFGLGWFEGADGNRRFGIHLGNGEEGNRPG